MSLYKASLALGFTVAIAVAFPLFSAIVLVGGMAGYLASR